MFGNPDPSFRIDMDRDPTGRSLDDQFYVARYFNGVGAGVIFAYRLSRSVKNFKKLVSESEQSTVKGRIPIYWSEGCFLPDLAK